MSLVYNEEQKLLHDSAKGFFAEKAPLSAVRNVRDQKIQGCYDTALWSAMVEMGFSGLLIAEKHDGLDFGAIGAGIVAEEIGRNLAASPFLTSAVIAPLVIDKVATEPQKKLLLPLIGAGEITATFALDEKGRHQPVDTSLKATKADGGYLLNGFKTFVPEGATSDKILVLGRTAGAGGEPMGLSLFVVDKAAEGLIIDETVMVDSRGWAKLTFENVQVSDEALLGEEGTAFGPVTAALDIATVIISAELLGIAQECLDRTVSYLKERKQFGVIIGTFQALQHRAALLYSEIEVTRSAVLKALSLAEAGADLSCHASIAKARAVKTAELATNEAIQLHGGIGMTDEFDMGFFIKRARVLAAFYGDYNYHADRFATLSGY